VRHDEGSHLVIAMIIPILFGPPVMAAIAEMLGVHGAMLWGLKISLVLTVVWLVWMMVDLLGPVWTAAFFTVIGIIAGGLYFSSIHAKQDAAPKVEIRSGSR
jgi:Na+/melibiose symporter-like transporter